MQQRSYLAAKKKGFGPLEAHEVPPPEDLTTDKLISLYMSDSALGLSFTDALWYFRPWRNDKPTRPGVYARFVTKDIYNGYSYFTGSEWLMAESEPRYAAAIGRKYESAVAQQNWKGARFYVSNHQSCLWSDAPLDGLEGRKTPTFANANGLFCNRPGTLRHELALLRYALDPLRRTSGLGELFA
jgi:hypothetical protein